MKSGKQNTAEKKTCENGRRIDLPFRVLDAVIIAAVLMISILPLFLLPKSEADTVVIKWHGEEIYREKLSENAVVTTPDGKNTIEIKNGTVYMFEADCRDEICVKSGNASPSRPVVCLPNRVIIQIISESEEDSVSW